MHSAALHLLQLIGTPLGAVIGTPLAAAKSRVPFYLAGGALVLWAFLLSMGIGRRRPEFPTDTAGQRLVIAITALLVLGATAMAVATSGGGA